MKPIFKTEILTDILYALILWIAFISVFAIGESNSSITFVCSLLLIILRRIQRRVGEINFMIWQMIRWMTILISCAMIAWNGCIVFQNPPMSKIPLIILIVSVIAEIKLLVEKCPEKLINGRETSFRTNSANGTTKRQTALQIILRLFMNDLRIIPTIYLFVSAYFHYLGLEFVRGCVVGDPSKQDDLMLYFSSTCQSFCMALMVLSLICGIINCWNDHERRSKKTTNKTYTVPQSNQP